MNDDNKLGCIFYPLLGISLVISVITNLPIILYFIIFTIAAAVLYFAYHFYKNDRRQKAFSIKAQIEERERAAVSLAKQIELQKNPPKINWNLLSYKEKLEHKQKRDEVWKSLSKNEKRQFLRDQKFETEVRPSMEQSKLAVAQRQLWEKQRMEEIENRKAQIEKVRLEEAEKIAAEQRNEEIILQMEKRNQAIKERIKAKILAEEKNKQIESEAIQELLDAGLIDNNRYTGTNLRETIPTNVKVMVWKRDKEKCVTCFSNQNLEFDHIIPVSKGGANSVNNIQLLCRNCNRTKSNKIV